MTLQIICSKKGPVVSFEKPTHSAFKLFFFQARIENILFFVQ